MKRLLLWSCLAIVAWSGSVGTKAQPVIDTIGRGRDDSVGGIYYVQVADVLTGTSSSIHCDDVLNNNRRQWFRNGVAYNTDYLGQSTTDKTRVYVSNSDMTSAYFTVKVINPAEGWGTDKFSSATSYDSSTFYSSTYSNMPPYIPSCGNVAFPDGSGNIARCMTVFYTTSNPQVVWQQKVGSSYVNLSDDGDGCQGHHADMESQCKEFKAIVYNRKTNNSQVGSAYAIFYCVAVASCSSCPGTYAIFDAY